jgi:septal ring factor EnvC (AmiA/AmiB activator)
MICNYNVLNWDNRLAEEFTYRNDCGRQLSDITAAIFIDLTQAEAQFEQKTAQFEQNRTQLEQNRTQLEQERAQFEQTKFQLEQSLADAQAIIDELRAKLGERI